MKKLKFALIAATATFFVQSAIAQTADEVITKYIDAIGGKEKIAALKSVKMVGSLSVQGIDVGITNTIMQDKGSRTDIAVPGMGDGFQIMNTAKGWNFLPFQGQASPEEVPQDQVKASQSLLDLQGPMFNYKEKGSTVELAGKETIEGAEAFKIKLTNKAGKITTYFIDSKTFYKVKTTSPSPKEGEPEVEISYADFRKTPEGYVFPYSVTNARGTILFTSIDINKPVDEKIFTAE